MRAKSVMVFGNVFARYFEDVDSFGPETTDSGPIFWVEGKERAPEGLSAKGYFEFHRDEIRSISIVV